MECLKHLYQKKQVLKMHHFGYELENMLFWEGLYGTWEKESLKIWATLSKDSNMILDIGANTGVYALISSAINPKCKIHAFEPVERVFKRLNYNLEINKSPNITTHKIGVSNNDGEATIYDSLKTYTYSVTINKNLWSQERKVKEVKIPIKKLSTFIEENKLKKIDLLKIDVETHEHEVLLGMGEHLKTMQPTLLIEILNDKVASKIEALIKDIEYLYFNVDEQNAPFQVKHLTKSRFHNFLICKKAVAKKLGLVKS